ncbi:hypothetical protein GIB67_010488 [Kingdonia uniflora]|uniref:UBN2_3 domain-containing protein n=1 Tax=Kingdonia uniflora TaxID=39325 RepID=A0A7J7MAU7_9MAGN|nr:hypothetical protein GIB67_010488 [Kingdonia uniflora]
MFGSSDDSSSINTGSTHAGQTPTAAIFDISSYHYLTETDATYGKWFTNSSMILGWILNSMETEIYKLFTSHKTVVGLWTALTDIYVTSQNEVQNEVQVYELYREIGQASQGSLSVTTYFRYLKKRWEELTVYTSLTDITPNTGMTPEIVVVIHKREKKQKDRQFLIGLQYEFECICTQVLNTSPLPSLGEAYALIEKHEHHGKLSSKVLVVSNAPSSADQMAFAANFRSSSYSGCARSIAPSGRTPVVVTGLIVIIARLTVITAIPIISPIHNSDRIKIMARRVMGSLVQQCTKCGCISMLHKLTYSLS